MSLIGHFDLDPNRVFDIALEFFELQPDNTIFLALIPIFPKYHASQNQRIEVNSPVPFGLYKLTALLVKEEFIDLDSIRYAHLLPRDDEAFEHYKPNKIGKINLAATGKDLMDDDKQGDMTIELFAAFDMETEAVAERYHAHIPFDHLSSPNPVAHVQICDAFSSFFDNSVLLMFGLVEKLVSPAYDIIRQMHLQNFGCSSGPGIDSKDTISSLAIAASSATAARTSRSVENQKQMEESANRIPYKSIGKATSKNSTESEVKASGKQSIPAGSIKTPKQDLAKDDSKSGKAVGRTPSTSSGDKDIPSHLLEGRQGNVTNVSSAITSNDNGAAKSVVKDDVTKGGDIQKQPPRLVHAPRHDSSLVTTKSSDKLQRRTSPAEDPDRLSKRWKGDSELRDLEGEVRFSNRERSMDARLVDLDKTGIDEQSMHRSIYKVMDRLKDKGNERYDSEYSERSEHPDKSRGDDILLERSTDRSMERYGRKHSVERGQERGADRNFDWPSNKAKDERNKDDRSKLRYGDTSMVKSHDDDRFYGQNLPPPPPLTPHVVPQSVNSGKRDEDAYRSFGTTRHTQRLSPRHEEKERRHSEEILWFHNVEEREREREREREKVNLLKEEMDISAASKRRKLKREQLSLGEAGEYSPVAPPPPPLPIGMLQSYDGRDRGDRKGAMIQRAGYFYEPPMRIHGKEAANKMTRHDADLMYDREWDDDKRQRAEQKWRHRKQGVGNRSRLTVWVYQNGFM
ncbi:hypothetical protein GH714_040338 [Hevea brasiliensis]|uniref:Uncharacterized protein n=1 Tax=Hevea brasiliensis TaxID=3981 RepID=A0A6A6MV24_HEVBR|nr:hypothetical protein GH714_040338 [Hevea brasiliensis]